MDSKKDAILKQRLWRKPSKRVQVFIVCLFVSAFIWTTRELTKEGNTLLNIPIESIGLANSLALTSSLPKTLEVRVSSFGLARFRSELKRSFDPILIDLSFIKNAGIFNIQSGQITQYIRENLGSDVEIIRFSPQNIQIEIEKIITKKVKIEPTVQLTYKNGFFLDGEMICAPDSINIYGIQSVLDTIRYIYTENISESLLNHSISKKIQLKIPTSVKSDISIAKITVPIDEYTEGELYKILAPILDKDNRKIIFFPDSIKITYRVGLNNYDKVRTEDIILGVDINSGNETSKKQVVILKQPDYINNIRIKPNRVEHYVFK